MKKLILLIIFSAYFKYSNGQVTWSADVASIIYSNCSKCHNSYGIAPFTLLSYQDAYQNGSDIKDQVINRTMPPWPPDPNYNHLAHERILTQQQITAISDWVDNGMLRGDSTLEPAPPVFNNISEIANPDHIAQAPIYSVNTSSDLYRCFVIPTNFLTDNYIKALEAIPGDRSIVHHILIYSDTSSIPTTLDAADPGPGYTNFGGTGSIYSKLIGAWVPGQSVYYSPNGMGIRLPANTNIIMQIHYPGGTLGKTDSTKLLLKTTTTPQREIFIESPLNHYQLDNGPLIIPANTIRTFNAHYVIPAPYDLSIMSVGPHMHLVGKSISSYGVTPTNDTIPFIDIPNWDFHWQGNFSFQRVVHLPAGTTIYSEATYDNTTANPNNPNSPPQLVHLGEATTDEMMLVYFSYTYYLPGDENIILDSTLITTNVVDIHSSKISTAQLYEPYPNPVSHQLQFQYYLPESAMINISILDAEGKLIKNEIANGQSGLSTTKLDVSNYAAGIYFITLKTGDTIRVKKFLKN